MGPEFKHRALLYTSDVAIDHYEPEIFTNQ